MKKAVKQKPILVKCKDCGAKYHAGAPHNAVQREAQQFEKFIELIKRHHLIKGSDLVGWYGRCSCGQNNMCPFDIEDESDYYVHLYQVAALESAARRGE